MTQVADAAIVYRPAEDGDMIQFGPNCALSLDKVRGMVSESGPIVRKAFEAWLNSLKAQACADAFKPLADAASKATPIDTGGPAFPHDQKQRDYGTEGMTLRDYFAAKIAASLAIGCAGELGREFTAYAKGPCNSAIAERAFALADAMIRLR